MARCPLVIVAEHRGMINLVAARASAARVTVMPIHYERDDTKRRILTISEGVVTLDDTLAVIERQAADGAWTYHMLFDTRASPSLPTLEELHQVVRHVGALTTRYGPRGPVAMVVVDPALYAIGGRYQRLADLTALRVGLFTTPQEAEEWLTTLEE
jgi:hypothetical protein